MEIERPPLRGGAMFLLALMSLCGKPYREKRSIRLMNAEYLLNLVKPISRIAIAATSFVHVIQFVARH